MRDYLYLWNEPREKRLVASGIEFRDMAPEVSGAGGVVLLRHDYAETERDADSGFDFVPHEGLARLIRDDIYGFGDFCWADFGSDIALAELTDEAIAELVYFAHRARPLRDVAVPGLANRFLCWAHDDGWHARLFYHEWPAVEGLLRRLLLELLNEQQAQQTLDALGRGTSAFWCRPGAVLKCERTENIDALQLMHFNGR